LDGPPAGKALDMVESGPITRRIRLLPESHCNGDLRRYRWERCGGDHGGISAEAGIAATIC